MTTTAARRPPTADVETLRARIDVLEADVATLKDIIGRTRGPRDDADRAVLAELAAAAEGRTFTTTEMSRHAAVRPDLRAALRAADIENPRQLGHLLRRLERAPVHDLQVIRTGEADRDGVVWQVLQVRPAETRPGPH